ncbi:MAG: GNAT family N-acetyltransferase [Candidatus Thorarchaeota archaeon]|nr:GNAT family N-acetyltransferase [Candidatus Thorarchaeota archaeon]
MIHAVSKKLTPEECRVLAGITLSSRKGTPIESSKDLEELAKEIEVLAMDANTEMLRASDNEGNIVGWIHYYIGFPLMGFIDGFLPAVAKYHDSEETALSLIEAAKKGITGHGHNRVESEFVFSNDEQREYSEKYVGWYRKAGFQFAAEEAHLVSDLGRIELPTIDAPEGYNLERFSSVAYKLLEHAGFRTFTQSNDDLFLSMTSAQQEVTLKHFFSTSKPFIEEASLVLERDDQVVGFVIARLKNNEVDIGPVGLVPEARGKGLANYLFVCTLQALKAKGITNSCLDVSIANPRARKLYERYGFKEVYAKQFYYWSA